MRKFLLLTVIAVGALHYFSGCKTKHAEATVVETTERGRIHVLLTDGADPEALIAAFPDYGLRNKGRASRSQNLYAFLFDPSRVSPSELQSTLQKDNNVLRVDIMKN